MKIAAYLATLVVRLLGIYLLFKSAGDLLTLAAAGFHSPVINNRAIVLVIEIGVGAVAVLLAGRIVRLFTVDAPLGNE
ncbi:MAG: hypothetical protein HYV96_07360 [Opitutae bacterium]|nr:hypothetical protein [Opitutae bacterium]